MNLQSEFRPDGKVINHGPRGLVLTCRVCFVNNRRPQFTGTIPALRRQWAEHLESPEHVLPRTPGWTVQLAQRQADNDVVRQAAATRGHAMQRIGESARWRCSCGAEGTRLHVRAHLVAVGDDG